MRAFWLALPDRKKTLWWCKKNFWLLNLKFCIGRGRCSNILFTFCNLTNGTCQQYIPLSSLNFLSRGQNGGELKNSLWTNFSDLLNGNGFRMEQIMAVTLLLQDMNHFPIVNQAYVPNFGLENQPPIRVCVQAPIEVKVCLSALGKSCANKETMHVQSISHWAPANIGPYSQATMVSVSCRDS